MQKIKNLWIKLLSLFFPSDRKIYKLIKILEWEEIDQKGELVLVDVKPHNIVEWFKLIEHCVSILWKKIFL